jgi:hypothetical protein
MVQLIAQTVAVVAAGGLLTILLRRSGVQLPFMRALTTAALVFLAVLGVAAVQSSWRELDLQRARNAHHTPKSARAYCARATGVDPEFLDWVNARIPLRATYHLSIAPQARGSTGLCVTFLLIPRIAVDRVGRARFVVFAGYAPPALLADVRRRRGTIETLRPGYSVARLP